MSDSTPVARTILWGAGWNTAGSLGAAGFNFIAILIVTRSLGVEAYARYSYLLWLASIGSMAAGAGLARPVARFVAQARGEGRPQVVAPLVRRSGALVTALGLVLGPILAFAAHRLHPAFAIVPAALLTASVVAGAIAGVQTAALQGGAAFRGIAFANLLSAAALLVGSAVVALSSGGPEAQFGVAVAASATLVGAQGLLLWRHRSPKGSDASVGDAVRIHPEQRDYWLAALALMLIEAIVWQRPEVLFLASYSTAEQLAYYNAAWSLAGRLMLFATFVSPVLLAQVAAMRKSDESDRIRALYASSSRWLCLIATPGFLLLASLGAPVLRLLYGARYEPAASTLAILLLGALIATVSAAGSAVVYGTDRIGLALRFGAAAAATTLLLDYVLIPSFGAPGAAVANVLGQMAAVGATLAFGLAPSGFQFPWGVLMRAMAAGVFGAGTARLIAQALPDASGLLAASSAGLAIYLGLVVLSGALRNADWSLVTLLAPGIALRSAGVRAFLIRRLGPPRGDRP